MTPSTSTALVFVALADSSFAGAAAGAGAGFSSTELQAIARTVASVIPSGQEMFLTKLFIPYPPRKSDASSTTHRFAEKIIFISLNHTSVSLVKASRQ